MVRITLPSKPRGRCLFFPLLCYHGLLLNMVLSYRRVFQSRILGCTSHRLLDVQPTPINDPFGYASPSCAGTTSGDEQGHLPGFPAYANREPSHPPGEAWLRPKGTWPSRSTPGARRTPESWSCSNNKDQYHVGPTSQAPSIRPLAGPERV